MSTGGLGWERYRRQLDLDGLGEAGQHKLGESTVVVFGLGGLGSAAATYLAAAGVGRLVLVDRDRVELSNLNRQILYDTTGLGKPKTELARDRLAALNDDIVVEAHAVEITAATAARLAAGADVMVDALDNFPGRFEVNAAAVRLGTPLVFGACESLEGRVATILPGRTPCTQCLFPDPPDRAGRPILGATAGITGVAQAMETIKLLTGIGESLAGRLLIFDGIRWTFDIVRAVHDPDCPVCGAKRRAQ